MSFLTKFSNLESKIDFQKTIRYKDIQEIVESYLENVDIVLDKIKVSILSFFLNKSKQIDTSNNSLLIKTNNSIEINSDDSKPQNLFKDKIDNSYEIPFIPKLKEKPNALAPLDPEILLAQSNPQKFFEQRVKK
jgi:hypothetical protein